MVLIKIEGLIFFKFTLNIEIPNSKLNELLVLINFANQNSKEGYFVFDFKVNKIQFNFVTPYSPAIEEKKLKDYLIINLNFISNLFHNFASGVHNLVYGDKFEGTSLELLFLENKGSA